MYTLQLWPLIGGYYDRIHNYGGEIETFSPDDLWCGQGREGGNPFIIDEKKIYIPKFHR